MFKSTPAEFPQTVPVFKISPVIVVLQSRSVDGTFVVPIPKVVPDIQVTGALTAASGNFTI